MNNKLFSVLTAGLLTLTFSGCANQPASTEIMEVTGSTPLMQAASAGDLSMVNQLIREGSPINAVSSVGTALTKASESGQKDVVLALLRAGANPNLGVAEGQTSPLHRMAELGDIQGMKTLIAAGANLDHRDSAGLTPIALAVRGGSLPAAKTLINAGANVNVVMQGRSLLMQVVEQNSLLMAQVLIKAGADVNFQADSGDTALVIARSRKLGDLEMLLIQSGARS